MGFRKSPELCESKHWDKCLVPFRNETIPCHNSPPPFCQSHVSFPPKADEARRRSAKPKPLIPLSLWPSTCCLDIPHDVKCVFNWDCGSRLLDDPLFCGNTGSSCFGPIYNSSWSEPLTPFSKSRFRETPSQKRGRRKQRAPLHSDTKRRRR